MVVVSFCYYQLPLLKVKVSVTQSCFTLCDSIDCSPLDSSVLEILQARILEWVDIPFFRGSSWPRDWTRISYIVGRSFTVWVTREVQCSQSNSQNFNLKAGTGLSSFSLQLNRLPCRHTHACTHIHTHILHLFPLPATCQLISPMPFFLFLICSQQSKRHSKM